MAMGTAVYGERVFEDGHSGTGPELWGGPFPRQADTR